MGKTLIFTKEHKDFVTVRYVTQALSKDSDVLSYINVKNNDMVASSHHRLHLGKLQISCPDGLYKVVSNCIKQVVLKVAILDKTKYRSYPDTSYYIKDDLEEANAIVVIPPSEQMNKYIKTCGEINMAEAFASVIRKLPTNYSLNLKSFLDAYVPFSSQSIACYKSFIKIKGDKTLAVIMLCINEKERKEDNFK